LILVIIKVTIIWNSVEILFLQPNWPTFLQHGMPAKVNMTPASQEPAGLDGLPTEILLEICQHLDVQSIFYLAEVERKFHNLVESNKASILLPVLKNEFSPFEELLQLYTASEEDLRFPGATYQQRKVVFKRHLDDHSGMVLSSGGFPAAPLSHQVFSKVRKGSKPRNFTPLLPPRVAILGDRDINPILRYCLDVRKWEQRFPQFRFIKEPAGCRWLNDDEKERLRRALYRWWLYAFYFHGDMPRPRRGQPEACVDDIRTSQMRLYCTSDLLELLDLVATIKDLIQHYICPSLEQDSLKVNANSSTKRIVPNSMQNSFQILSHDGPNQMEVASLDDPLRRARVVSTYAKLDPRELMYYFDNLYDFSPKRLVTDIRIRHHTFARDQESLQAAIKAALDERHWLDNLPSLATDSEGGILDFGDHRDEEREIFGSDASHDGSLPLPAMYRPPHAEFSPRGDDGSPAQDGGGAVNYIGGSRWAAPSTTRRIMY
jgi:hypothetical protein